MLTPYALLVESVGKRNPLLRLTVVSGADMNGK